jgi:hypothetical protein
MLLIGPGVRLQLTVSAFPVGELQMLFAAKEVAARGDGFAGRQMHAADTASNHVFTML